MDEENLDEEGGFCVEMFPFPLFRFNGIDPGEEIQIGLESYEVEEIGVFGYATQSTGGESWARASHYAPDIGAFDYCYAHGGRQMPPVGSDDRWNAQLTYARISGVEYGTKRILVSSEDEAALPQTLRIVDAYPNPFSDQFQITTTGMDPAPATLRVFDLLGRQVHVARGEFAGSSMHVNLDDRPAGIYLVQLTTSSGTISSATVVKSGR